MQVRLLALVLLQPERLWSLQELSDVLSAPLSSVHRELSRAADAGMVHRDDQAKPHRFSAATEDASYPALADLLNRTVGVESELRTALSRPDVQAAAIYGSWASGARRPNSDVDVLVVGDAGLRDLRRVIRPIEKSTDRRVDLTLLNDHEFHKLIANRSSFLRGVLDSPMSALVGDLEALAAA
ncbi:MAG TPA: nucleotidyltransferase domain-containing protein [Solirubrobacteraceae bacterium]